MVYRNIFLAILFYYLALFQNSFLIHFSVFGALPNLIVILLCLLAFFEPKRLRFGVLLAIIAGLFQDLILGYFIGVSVASFLIIYYAIKYAKGQLSEHDQNFYVLYFGAILSGAFIFNRLFIGVYDGSLFSFNILILLLEVVYNLIIGTIGFYFAKLIVGVKHESWKV